MYVVANIGKKYTAEFCARKCDVTIWADDVIEL